MRARPLKALAKLIFPAPLLKKAFGIYNLIKVATIDKLLFPELKIDVSEFHYYRVGFPFVENAVDVNGISNHDVRGYMEKWKEWHQEEFILNYEKPCWIEPSHGWAIAQGRRLMYYSLGLGKTWFQPRPSFLKFKLRRKTRSLDCAISLRDTGEENYFHFYNDVISKLWLLKNHQIDIEDRSVIVSLRLWSKPYFQYYIRHANLRVKWVIQRDEYIHCESIFFCKALTHRKDLWASIFQPIIRTSGRYERIFIARNPKRLRFVENQDALSSIARKFGFVTVDADQIEFEEQISLFSGSKCIIGVHGAGLTNIFFSKHPSSIFEIFPPPDENYLPFHYLMLADMKNFGYQGLIGKKSESLFSGGFYVEPGEFENALKNWVNDLPSENL